MKQRFVHIKKRRIIQRTEKLMSIGEVRQVLFNRRPKEIWCNQWSSKLPFLEILEFLPETDEIKLVCNADSDKSGEVIQVQQFYNRFRYGGLRHFEF